MRAHNALHTSIMAVAGGRTSDHTPPRSIKVIPNDALPFYHVTGGQEGASREEGRPGRSLH